METIVSLVPLSSLSQCKIFLIGIKNAKRIPRIAGREKTYR